MVDWRRIWNDEDNIRRFSPARAILYLLSLLYRLIINLRNWFYDRKYFSSVRLGCPVISVGNITVGGTGKTPCVIMLARFLREQGFRPAVISRGYRAKNAQRINIISDGETIFLDAAKAGDEPLLIARSLQGVPVITGARRFEAGAAAIDKFGANVLVCDDAFQHRKLARDIDMVLLDYEKPLGNNRLLPAGALREPARGLKRAGCVMFTRARVDSEMKEERVNKIAREKNIPVFYSFHKPKDLISGDGRNKFLPHDLTGKAVCAFCGIAMPESFKKMLLDLEAKVISFDPFPDHYFYNYFDLEELRKKYFSSNADYLITTEKDAMRLTAYPEYLKIIYILRLDMEVTPSANSLENFILDKLAMAADRQAQTIRT